MSIIQSLFRLSIGCGVFVDFREGIPSWPKPLLPQAQSFPFLSKATVKSIPHATFTIPYRLTGIGVLQSPSLPIVFLLPQEYNFPSLVTATVWPPAQATCFTLVRPSTFLIFFQQTLRSCSTVPMLLNLTSCCSIFPQIQTSPSLVTAHICWYPQHTCLKDSLLLIYLGTNTFRFELSWPRTPLRALPHVYSLPSGVIPAEYAFLALISLNFNPCNSVGMDLFDSIPRPSSPFLPEPHTQRFHPLIYSSLQKAYAGIATSIGTNLQNLLIKIKTIFGYNSFLSRSNPQAKSSVMFQQSLRQYRITLSWKESAHMTGESFSTHISSQAIQ